MKRTALTAALLLLTVGQMWLGGCVFEPDYTALFGDPDTDQDAWQSVEPSETELPETESPETEPPETELPETELPETESPETEPSETESPETEPSETDSPETEPPETEPPETESPETEPSETEPPKTESPETMVWIPTNGGTKYHRTATCSQMQDPAHVTLAQAITEGYEPCGRCYQ